MVQDDFSGLEISKIYLWQHWDGNYYWCWGRPCTCGELVSGFHHCNDEKVVRKYDFCCILSSLIVYHINLGWSCNHLSAPLISWHHPVFWTDAIKSKDQNASPMRRAVGLGDLRKGIKKTFTFYFLPYNLRWVTPIFGLFSLLSDGEFSELLCMPGTQAAAAPGLTTAKTRSSPRLGPFQLRVIIRMHLLTGKHSNYRPKQHPGLLNVF